MIDTVIFDLDGTLLNTLDDLTNSVNYALSESGLAKRDISEIKSFVGNGVEQLIERAVAGRLSTDREKECLAIFKLHYSRNMNNLTKPYEGIVHLVKELLRLQYRIAIVSNKFDAAVKELNRLYFEDLFPVAIGATEYLDKKPAPDLVNLALEQLGSSTKSAIYIGDSDVDALTAYNSHLPFIGVEWGFRDKELLLSMGAECVIQRPEELLTVLNRRNGF